MEFESCAVCGRTILRGEQSFDYVDDDGQGAVVCSLCRQRAEATGWLPAALATAKREPAPLAVFNASSEVRKVAGLRRSLGEPRVCVRPEARDGGEVVVVAWDLSWYRWSIRGDAVKQLAKGNEISELPVEDRAWNATAAEDGTLTRA
ncbi:MAG TPA: hypothetical protein VID76_03845 [Solirubrobacterales bacterium]